MCVYVLIHNRSTDTETFRDIIYIYIYITDVGKKVNNVG